MPHPLRLRLAAIPLLATLSAPAEETAHVLPDVVVTATRRSTPALDLPFTAESLSGTVNALTASPLEEGEGSGGRVYYRHATAEDSHLARFDGHHAEDGRFGLRAGLTLKQFGDLRTGSGDRQPKSGYDEYAADGSVLDAGIQGPVADEARYGMLGLYAERSHVLGERTDLIAGGRYTRIEAEADAFEKPQTGRASRLSQRWDAAVGSLRAIARPFPDERIRLFAGLSQGFRAPNLSDLTRLDSARSGEIETPSPASCH